MKHRRFTEEQIIGILENSLLVLNKKVTKQEAWSDDQIEERGKQFFEFAKNYLGISFAQLNRLFDTKFVKENCISHFCIAQELVPSPLI